MRKCTCGIGEAVEHYYEGDENGLIFMLRDTGRHHTGVLLPRMASRVDIPEADLFDEIDVVYKPLSSGVKRKHLMLTTDDTGNV